MFYNYSQPMKTRKLVASTKFNVVSSSAPIKTALFTPFFWFEATRLSGMFVYTLTQSTSRWGLGPLTS